MSAHVIAEQALPPVAAPLVTGTVDELPDVPASAKRAIVDGPRSVGHHREWFARVEALHAVETGGVASAGVLPEKFRIAAWNLERCIDPVASAALIAKQEADIVLLSEMDAGMARTGQVHTTHEIADRLGMAYAFGVEFFELGLGSAVEARRATDPANRSGWHGNAILSRVVPSQVALARLDDHGHWFVADAHDGEIARIVAEQPRIGGRMAVLALLDLAGGATLCAVSVHLESHAGVAHRAGQMRRLLDAVQDFAGDTATVIGGDLNTGATLPDRDWRHETLFDVARKRGYSWDANPSGRTTRTSSLSRSEVPAMKLDWFAVRGLSMRGASIVPALSDRSEPLSDHEMIAARCSVAAGP